MNARLALFAALLALTSASLGCAQSGFVPTGSIVIDCDAGCRIEMPAFGLVEVAEPQETVSLGGLPAGTYDLRIGTDSKTHELTAIVCGAATAIQVVGGEATVEPPLCAPFGFLAVTLPPGARAELAQRTLRASTTAALYVGAYAVVFTKADGEEQTSTVVVSEGATTDVGLAPPDATVTFAGVPLDAIIRFSRAGSFEGPGPHVLAPGLYVVEIDAPGFAKTSFTLHLEAGAQLQREVQLVRLPPGYARLLVTPPTATIEIAGRTYFAADAIRLAQGDYVATVTAPGYETATVPFTVRSSVTSSVEVRLSAILGVLELRVEPSDAVVRIAGSTFVADDGVFVGAPGDYVATVTAPGYETATVPVTITAEATATVEVRLIEILGRVVLRVEPRNAVVRIAGNTYAAGETVRLPPSIYTVSVSAPGFEPFEGTFDITPTTDATVLEVSLARRVVVSAITAGFDHSLALLADGTVWAWGWNDHGQLGDGTTTHGRTPVQVSGLSNVTSIGAGTAYSLALRTDGTVWAWGSNNHGQLGDGTTTNRRTPVQVSGLGNVTSITAGGSHALALRTDGTVWAWGWNNFGGLGDGTTTNRRTPVQVGGLSNVTSISAGSHTLALRTDGTVWAWGRNGYGQLGDGTNNDSRTPVRVGGLGNVTSITAKGAHSLALRTDGTVWAWGWNSHGQLGDGTTTNRRTPVQVGGLGNVTSIAADHHSLALRTDGTVWAWGWNSTGQLGDGTFDNRRTPLQVSGLSNVVSVMAGEVHSLALRTDGTVWEWGNRRTPGQVNGLGGLD